MDTDEFPKARSGASGVRMTEYHADTLIEHHRESAECPGRRRDTRRSSVNWHKDQVGLSGASVLVLRNRVATDSPSRHQSSRHFLLLSFYHWHYLHSHSTGTIQHSLLTGSKLREDAQSLAWASSNIRLSLLPGLLTLES